MTRVCAVLLFGVVLSACGGADVPDAAHSDPEATSADLAAQPATDVVRIAAEMMRDLRVTTSEVESRTGGEEATLLGELHVNQDAYAEVGTPIAARVVRLLASPGDRVGRGQGLLELQSVELGRARADYLSARARLDLSERHLRRLRELAAERIVPQREVQEAETEVIAASATFTAASAVLAALGLPVPAEATPEAADSLFMLTSPIEGTVLERAAVLGQTLDPTHVAFRVADLSRLWLTVHAFERDAVRVVRGASARVAFPALPGRAFTGRISLIGREVESSSRTVPIRVDIANPAGELRPGMTASAAVPIDRAETPFLTVPAASLQRVRDDWVVFVPQDASTFQIRKVGRGRDLSGEVEILTGLAAGETVVVDGAFLLRSEAEKARGESHEGH